MKWEKKKRAHNHADMDDRDIYTESPRRSKKNCKKKKVFFFFCFCFLKRERERVTVRIIPNFVFVHGRETEIFTGIPG
jgi:hypothetical protein